MNKFIQVAVAVGALAFSTQNAHANLLTLSCNILNEGRFPQTEFLTGDIAIFKVKAISPQNGMTFDPTKDYRIDFKITAQATIGGLKVPFKFNESFSAPLRKEEGSFSITEEKKVKLPSIRGKLALQVSANIVDHLDSSAATVNCKKTLTIR